MDELGRYILGLDTSRRNEVDLVNIGRTAARRYLNGDGAMNDFIKEAADTQNLNADQVRRIIESANLAAYKAILDGGKFDKNIEFDVADPDVIFGSKGAEKSASVAFPVPSPRDVPEHIKRIADTGFFPSPDASSMAKESSAPRRPLSDTLELANMFNVAMAEASFAKQAMFGLMDLLVRKGAASEDVAAVLTAAGVGDGEKLASELELTDEGRALYEAASKYRELEKKAEALLIAVENRYEDGTPAERNALERSVRDAYAE